MHVFLLDAVSALLALATLFAYFNHYVLQLPRSIVLLVTSTALSLKTILIDRVAPGSGLAHYPSEEMTCWPVSPRVANVKNNDPKRQSPGRLFRCANRT